ncbi:MAG: hypothetical protein HY978_03755 [Candidatus Liptonbacteria bacterium]|nr:hypothetical protein [Candidatus Liptonbacteria bacterium]
MNIKRFSLAVAVIATAPLLVFAVDATKLTPPAPIKSLPSAIGLVCTGISWAFTIAIIVSIIYVLVAAYQYVSGGTNPEKISKAHDALTWAAVGIIVAILAAGVPAVVGSFVGQNSGLEACPFQKGGGGASASNATGGVCAGGFSTVDGSPCI